ncbi:MAG: succinylglutamate desuccinylase/aspartoacylase family protein [Ktedonobacteraceae bacterium]
MPTGEITDLPWHERTWQIGTIDAARAGTRSAGLIEYGSYADGTLAQTAVHVLVGAEEGPVLYVQAAVHGDEVNGVEVVRRVVSAIDPKQMRGVLIAVPVVNGPSFIHHQRRNPFDEEDMNRIWPGNVRGLTSQQMAYHLYNQAVRHAQYVIDLHTANSNTMLHVVYGRGDEASRKMAEVFALPVLLEENVNEELTQARFTGKLRNTLTAQGIAAITPELGGNNYFEEKNIVLGVRGVINVMIYLAMLQGVIEPAEQPQITLYGSHLDKVRATYGGIWVAQVQAGTHVRKGQLLGHTYSIRTFEAVESPTAPYDGYVTGTADVPTINIGDALVAICRLAIEM